MTDQNQTPQVSAQQLLNMAIGTSFGRAVTGAIVGLIGLLLPFITISANFGMGMSQSQSLNGLEAAGWIAWLALVALIVAAASWKVEQLAPYRLIAAGVAVALAVLTIIIAWFFNPAAQQLNEVNSTMAALGASDNMINIGPHIGMLVLLIGAGLVGWTGYTALLAEDE